MRSADPPATYTAHVRFGLALPHYDTSLEGRPVTWEGVRAAAVVAERSGFDSVWVSDHFFLDWGKYGGPETLQGALECWTTLSAIAAVTERVRVGSLTLCNDFRSPALVAKAAASLDVLSGGRVDVGLGGGWYEPEYRAAGIAFDSAGTRIRRLGEAAEIITRLLAGEEVVFEGRYYTLDGALCRPRPVQDPRPPVWIGGKGDRLITTALEHADGWNFSWIGSLPAYRERVEFARTQSDKIGRDFGTFRRSMGAYLTCGRDDADVRKRFERLVGRTPAGVIPGSESSAAVSWDDFRRHRIAGTVKEVVDVLGEIRSLGVEEVIFSLGALPFQVADLEDVEFVGSEVFPALR